jgi:hypothetical protein
MPAPSRRWRGVDCDDLTIDSVMLIVSIIGASTGLGLFSFN